MMTNRPRFALTLGAAMICLAGCQRAEQAATTAQSAVQAQSTPTLSTADATFLNLAVTSGIEEVNFSQMAETKAQNPAIRQFADQMVADHTKLNQQLTTLAQSKQLTPPSSMDSEHDQMYSAMHALSGRAFDRAYVNGQVSDHKTSIEAYQTEANSGSDPQVKNLAAQNLPILQQHLDMAQKLAGRR